MKYYIRIVCKSGYRYKDNSGNKLNKQKLIDQFNKLYIVPIYKQTKFFKTKEKVYASSIDSKGRTQYSYNQEFKEEREKKKLKQLKHFLKIQSSLERKINSDLEQSKNIKNKLIASILKLMKICNFRIGNDNYEKEYGSIGLTTLKSKHIKFKNDITLISFNGKKGVLNDCTFKNKKMQSILKSLSNNSKKYLFSYKSENNNLRHITNNDVHEYLEVFEITNKDIRMSNANFLFMHFFNSYIKNINFLELDEKEQKKIIKACAEKVAHYLHNTVNVALNSYISKELIEKIKKIKVKANLNVNAQIKKLIT